MKITVTQHDIEQGSPFSSCDCPIALAAKRVMPNDEIQVSTQLLWTNTKGYYLPAVAMDFIERFDYGVSVEPFEFEIDECKTV